VESINSLCRTQMINWICYAYVSFLKRSEQTELLKSRFLEGGVVSQGIKLAEKKTNIFWKEKKTSIQ